MKRFLLGWCLVFTFLSFAPGAYAVQEGETVAELEDPVQIEEEIATSLREAVLSQKWGEVKRLLRAKNRLEPGNLESAAIARRAVVLCSWFMNEDDYAAAEGLAEFTLKLLSRIEDEANAQKSERPYWEAWLESRVLGHHYRAFGLIEEGLKYAPEDERLQSELDHVSGKLTFSKK